MLAIIAILYLLVAYFAIRDPLRLFFVLFVAVCNLPTPSEINLGFYVFKISHIYIFALLCLQIGNLSQINLYEQLKSFSFAKPLLVLALPLALCDVMVTMKPTNIVSVIFSTVFGIFILAYIFELSDHKNRSKEIANFFTLFVLANGLYAFYCYGLGANPYELFVKQYLPDTQSVRLISESYAEDLRFGIAGRQQAFFNHPITYGAVLTCIWAVMAKLFFNRTIGNIYFAAISAFIVVNIALCASRSAYLFAMVVAFGIMIRYFFAGRRYIQLASLGLFSLIALLLTDSFGAIYEALEPFIFFFDDAVQAKHGITGSSLEMRMDQFSGVFSLIEDSLLFGNGRLFILGYLTNYGGHPVLLGFESILFSIPIMYGLVGTAAYFAFFTMVLKSSFHPRNGFLQILFVGYMALIVSTGFMGTLPIFLATWTILRLLEEPEEQPSFQPVAGLHGPQQ